MLALVLLQTLYSIGFIFRSSIVVEGTRYFALFDDALISMRYGANLVQGEGLVWNPGERVEGYTNFAWTLVLALLHLPGLGPSTTCLLVQLVGIPVLGGCLGASAALARACRLVPSTAIIAVVLVAMHYNLVYFSLLGMETGALCLLVTLGLTSSVNSLRRKTGTVRALLWFVPAVLMRTDAVIVAAWVCACLVLFVERRRLRPVLGMMIVLAVLGAQMLWRHSYYGDWWPNTYYLRMTGWPASDRLVAGVINSMGTMLTLGLPALLALRGLVGPRRRIQLLLLGAFALIFAYQVYVGGDAWPLNRFVIPTTAGLFVVSAVGIQRLVGDFLEQKASLTGKVATTLLVLSCLASVNGIHWDHLLLVSPPQQTSGNQLNLRLWRAIERVVDPDASVGVGYAGLIPYFSGRTCVDWLGKCEPHVARLPVVPGLRRPGHNKRDALYIVTTCKPDVIVHADGNVVRQRYYPIAVQIDGTEVIMFVRNGCPRVSGGRRVPLDPYNPMITRPDPD